MFVESFAGAHEIETVAELETLIHTQHRNDANNLWISRTRGSHPVLAILVRANQANVHYFPEPGHPGHVARNPRVDAAAPDVVFYTNTDTEKIVAGAAWVVSLEDAIAAARAFFAGATLPGGLHWDEL
ncbi:MAG: hypothetical protein HOO96_18275 [Polyangiaceae bacterium]|nr:hypothetical protein [Polyangiaceae bacterium]